MPTPVERYDPDGIDYAWVMQVTFIMTIVVGVPVVTLASTQATLPTWTDRARFAVGIGAAIWFIIALTAFAFARRRVG